MSAANELLFVRALDFGSAWTKQVFINGVAVQMKIDTGADVTAILLLVVVLLLLTLHHDSTDDMKGISCSV